MELNISVTHGHLSFPNTPMLARDIEVYTSVIVAEDGDGSTTSTTSTIYRVKDCLTNINAVISNITYLSPINWYGSDSLDFILSDNNNLGYSNSATGSALTDSGTIIVTVKSVDDPFTLATPLNAYVIKELWLVLYSCAVMFHI